MVNPVDNYDTVADSIEGVCPNLPDDSLVSPVLADDDSWVCPVCEMELGESDSAAVLQFRVHAVLEPDFE